MTDSTIYQQVKTVMTHDTIPAGQLRLYKALLEAPQAGVTFAELAQATQCTKGDTRSTFGAAGKRVTTALGKIYHKPSRLLIARSSSKIYTLSPTLLQFIENTPSFKKALVESSIEMFNLHSNKAWVFVWDNENSGHLVEFTRG